MARLEVPIKVDIYKIEELIDQLKHLQTYKLCAGDEMTLVDRDDVVKIIADHVKAEVSPPDQRWTPCSERRPEEKINQNTQDFEFVLCSTTFGDVRPYKFGKPIGWEEAHFWHGGEVIDKYVVAWRQMPKPWEGGTK